MEKIISKIKNSKTDFLLEVLFVVLCISIMGVLLAKSALNESLTFDEFTHVQAGYQFLTNQDFRYDPFNPPLARELVSAPVIFGIEKLNDPLLFYSRAVSILTTLLLAVLVYIIAKNLYGRRSAFFALLFLIFEPNILANGHYAGEDMIFTFFFILNIYVFWKWKYSFSKPKLALFGLLTGLTLSTKFSALPFLFFCFLITFLYEKKNRQEILKRTYWVKKYVYPLIFILFLALSLWGTYFFTLQPLLGYRFDPNRFALSYKNNPLVGFALNFPLPLGSYISTIKQQISYNYTAFYTKNTYFYGNISTSGLPGIFLIPLLFIKIPIPLILMFLSSFFYFKKTKKDIFILIALSLILFLSSISKTIIVLRYVLPIIPLVIIYSSKAANFSKNKVLAYGFVTFLLLWEISNTLSVYPFYISFYNEFAGGYENGYKYAVDSNYDWGQGLIALSKFQKQNKIDNLYLDYFGSVDPKTYGVDYKQLSINSFPKNKNLTLAISASCYYFCGYYKLSYLAGKKPERIIGGSILIFNN